MRIGFLGAGRLATGLAQALTAAGQPVAAIASRNAASAQALAAQIDSLAPQSTAAGPLGAESAAPEAKACIACRAQDLPLHADLVFLTTPDDALAQACASVPWRAGMAAVHTSGACELAVLDRAQRMGALTGGFHPLQIFSDPDTAASRLRGASVAIEAPVALEPGLRQLAARLGMNVLTLPPGTRAAYHAGAAYAASYLLVMLREAERIWQAAGIDAVDARLALLPLAQGTLAAAHVRGLAGALSGPLMRGDAQVVAAHGRALAALPTPARDILPLYRTLAMRQLALAQAGGRLTQAVVQGLHEVLDSDPFEA